MKVALRESSDETNAEDLPGVCLQIDVDRAYAGQTVELAITAEDAASVSLFNGGAIRAFLSVDQKGSHHCFTLWRQLGRLGMTSSMPLTTHRAPRESAHACSKPLSMSEDDQASPLPAATAIALSTVRAFPLSAVT